MDFIEIPSPILYIGLLKSLPRLIQNLNHAIEARDHQQTIRFTSNIIGQACLSKLPLALLDARSHAHSMQGQFGLAISDCNQMIKMAPTCAAGYLRKGNLLSMYGRQRDAVKTYNQGIEAVKSEPIYTEQLVAAKSMAEGINGKRVDFIAHLPAEVSSEIIARLPQKAKLTCLLVSKIWRTQVIDCSIAWKNLVIDEDQEHIQLLQIIPSIGQHIKFLALNTASEVTQFACIKRLREGHLTKVKSLKIRALAMTQENFRSNIIMLSTAFWQVQSTLTRLQVNLGRSQYTLSMAEILLSCRNLTDLQLSTELPMSVLGGNFSLLNDSDSLINLELQSTSITGPHIRAILQRCKKLRRLVMNGCDTSVLEPINTYGQNLEILGYNHSNYNDRVPELQETCRQTQGLREIYTNNGGVAVPASAILPLLYSNMDTLEILFTNIADIVGHELYQIYIMYPNFKLKKLTSLTFWPLEGIQQLMLRSIQETTRLSYLCMVDVHDICDVVDTIIHLPALTTLRLSHVVNTNQESSLIQLFERYALVSQSEQSLKSVTLRYCPEITDTVVSSLAKIKTLQKVHLCGLRNVTDEGVTEFLNNVGDQLTYIKLADMGSVNDSHMVTLGGSKHLTTIDLESLPNLTDEGVQAIVSIEYSSVQMLKVKACEYVTNDYVRYEKRKNAVH